MTALHIISRLNSMLNINKEWLLDEFTDTMFTRHEELTNCYPGKAYDTRASLSVYYEYGEIQYVLAVVYSYADWRYCRQYEIPRGTYRWLQEYLYPWYDDFFADKGCKKPYGKGWSVGVFQQDYQLGQALDLPDWS